MQLDAENLQRRGQNELMKRTRSVLSAATSLLGGSLLVGAILTLPVAGGGTDRYVSAKVSVAFGSDCEEALLRRLTAAEKSVDVAIFTLARKRIADSLVRGASRGVRVRIKIDAEQALFPYTVELLGNLRKAGATVELIGMPEGKHMHHKFAVIDRRCVITGSFNWTRQAIEENWENLVCIESKRVAADYREEWERISSSKGE